MGIVASGVKLGIARVKGLSDPQIFACMFKVIAVGQSGSKDWSLFVKLKAVFHAHGSNVCSRQLKSFLAFKQTW